MIGDGIDIQEQRTVAALARDDLFGLLEVEAVRLETARPQIRHVHIVLDAGCGLEAARAEKSAVERIKAERFVTATGQRMRQPARDAAGGDARH